VRDYIAQLMFNSPPGLSDAMDLAKMLAVLDLIEPLARSGGKRRESFRIWRQTRTGLLSYPVDPTAARAHLAASVYLQMALKPHIVHVVGHTEAHHAASAVDVIEACGLAQRAIENAVRGAPDMAADPRVQKRRQELVDEALVTLQAIQALADPGVADPLVDPVTLARAVTGGILDAPQLRSNPFGRGRVRTRIVAGTCSAVDVDGRPLSEKQRLAEISMEDKP
jgi:hypothetical protein